jgi:hypothetical protein
MKEIPGIIIHRLKEVKESGWETPPGESPAGSLYLEIES